MTKERAKGTLNATDNEGSYKSKFIRPEIDSFKIVNKYEPIRESKRAGKKFVSGGPNVILTKKTKPGLWVGIDEKFLIRAVRTELSEGEILNENAVVYRIYRI